MKGDLRVARVGKGRLTFVDEAVDELEEVATAVEPARDRPAYWLGFLGLIGSASVVVAVSSSTEVVGTAVVVAGGLSFVAMLAGVIRRRPDGTMPWEGPTPEPMLLLAVSMLGFLLADVMRHSIPGTWLAPFPTTGDLEAVIAYPCALGALMAMVHDRVPGQVADSLFTAAIGAAGAGFVTWVLVGQAVSHSGTTSTLLVVTALAFPVLDLLMVAVTARLIALTDDPPAAYRYLSLGWLCLLVVHTTRAAALATGTVPANGTLGAASILAYGLWGVAALHPSSHELADPIVGPPPKLSTAQMALLAGTVLLGPAVLRLAVDRSLQDAIVMGSTLLSLFVVVHLLRMVQARSAIEHRVHHDELTGLPNRSLFNDRVIVALAHARRTGGMSALMFLDLDRFKNVNDSLGHAVGNQLLQAVARRLVQAVREEDTVARLGGDEFTILLPAVKSPDEATLVAQKLLTAFNEPFSVGKRKLFVSPSIGVALYPKDGSEPESLLKNADTAMYRAKEGGRKTFRVYNHSMNARAPEKLDLESALHTALEKKELVLHYQPKVDLRTGRIVGMEALARWHHPRLGFIDPSEFIPLAEETGLIVPLGEWAIEAACTQNKAWQDAGFPAITVAVNLSARQFQQQKIEDLTASILRRTGLDARFLEFEVTESLALQDPEGVTATLRDLKEMGVQCSIDDFGTGYSGLSYLTRFPIDRLKIDKSFVKAIGEDDGNAPIVVAVVALAHSLNMEVVAEGVETQEQLDFLRRLGCDQMQGYLFSRPLPADRLENLLMLELVIPGPGRIGKSDEAAPPDGLIVPGSMAHRTEEFSTPLD